MSPGPLADRVQVVPVRVYEVPWSLALGHLDRVSLDRIGEDLYRVTWWVTEVPAGTCRLQDEGFFSSLPAALATYRMWATWRCHTLVSAYETVWPIAPRGALYDHFVKLEDMAP